MLRSDCLQQLSRPHDGAVEGRVPRYEHFAAERAGQRAMEDFSGQSREPAIDEDAVIGLFKDSAQLTHS